MPQPQTPVKKIKENYYINNYDSNDSNNTNIESYDNIKKNIFNENNNKKETTEYKIYNLIEFYDIEINNKTNTNYINVQIPNIGIHNFPYKEKIGEIYNNEMSLPSFYLRNNNNFKKILKIYFKDLLKLKNNEILYNLYIIKYYNFLKDHLNKNNKKIVFTIHEICTLYEFTQNEYFIFISKNIENINFILDIFINEINNYVNNFKFLQKNINLFISHIHEKEYNTICLNNNNFCNNIQNIMESNLFNPVILKRILENSNLSNSIFKNKNNLTKEIRSIKNNIEKQRSSKNILNKKFKNKIYITLFKLLQFKYLLYNLNLNKINSNNININQNKIQNLKNNIDYLINNYGYILFFKYYNTIICENQKNLCKKKKNNNKIIIRQSSKRNQSNQLKQLKQIQGTRGTNPFAGRFITSNL